MIHMFLNVERKKIFCFRGKKWKGKGKFFVSAERNGKGKENFLMENLFPFLTLVEPSHQRS